MNRKLSSIACSIISPACRHRRLCSLFFLLFFTIISPFTSGQNIAWAQEKSFSTIIPPRVIQQKKKAVPAWKHLWDEGRVLVGKGNYQAAVTVYEALLAKRPKLEPAQWELSQLYILLKKTEPAISLLEELTNRDPRRIDYRLALADLYIKSGKTAQGVGHYKKVIPHRPGNKKVLHALAYGLLSLKKKSEAVEFLEALARQEGQSDTIKKDLAQLYCDLGDFAKARPLLVALAHAPKVDKEILRKAAWVHDKLGLANLAVEYWQRFAKQSPEDVEAAKRLTAYFVQEGSGEAALGYLLPELEKKPASPILLRRTGQVFMGLTRFKEALPYFERYIALIPDDKEVLRLVVDIHAVLGNKAETVAVLDRFLSLESEPDVAHLKQAATLYEQGGRDEEALRLYDRLIAATPDDPEILAKRARLLLNTEQDQAALDMWAHLAKRQKLLEVLQVLHGLEPANTTVALKLAAMYLDRGDLQRSLSIYEHLKGQGHTSPKVSTALASIYERLSWSEHAFNLYATLIDSGEQGRDIFLRAIRLAGELGLVAEVRDYAGRLEGKAELSLEERLILAQALAASGASQEALPQYDAIVQSSGENTSVAGKALLGLAEVYGKQGFYFEAEQYLREFFVLSGQQFEAYDRLFHLALAEKKYLKAGVWLDGLDKLAKELPTGDSRQVDSFSRLRILRAKFWTADGEHKAALKTIRPLLVSGDEKQARLGTDSVGQILHILLAAGDYPLAARILKEKGQGKETDLLSSVQQLFLAEKNNDGQAAARYRQNLGQGAQNDFAQQLRLITLCSEYKLYGDALTFAEQAVAARPDSLQAKLLYVKMLEENQQVAKVETVLQEAALLTPGNDFIAYRLARYRFSKGEFEDALGKADLSSLKELHWGLLRARTLWAQGRWPESIAVYQKLLSDSVVKQLAARGEKHGLRMPPEELGLWEQYVIPEVERTGFVDQVMTPEHLVRSDWTARSWNEVAAPLYASYRWQRYLALEHAARQAVIKRQYLAAKRYFELMAVEGPGDASTLFDLAGLYSRLGQLGPEAAVYEKMQTAYPEYSTLAAASKRNRLKRRPLTGLAYGYLKEEGRDGYKAIWKKSVDFSSWYSPSPRDEFDVRLSRIDYGDTDKDAVIRANRLLARYGLSFTERWQANFAAGLESVDGGGQSDALLFDCDLTGKIGNRLTTSVGYTRGLTQDTLASVGRNIIQQDFAGSVTLAVLSSFEIGGEYLHRDYSDGNSLNGYDLWASYLLFADPVSLQFTYTYDFQDAEEGNNAAGTVLADGFTASDHPYWAPKEYWQNRFSVAWQHQLSENRFARGAPRYYRAEYELAHDSKGYAIQTWKGGFFIEWTPHLLMQATAELTNSDEYRSKDFFFTATYRW